MRLYGLKSWVEQSYKQVKHELGWADFAVRSDAAIRRHWALVFCAFSFCWRAYLPAPHPSEVLSVGRGEKAAENPRVAAELALRTASGAELARPLVGASALVERMVDRAPAERTPALAGVGR